MEASFMIAQVETTLRNYTDQHHRAGMRDLAIWQSVCNYYASAIEYDIVITSTKEEAFDRMVKDGWTVYMGEHFFGLDYVTIDEEVLNYLKRNKLVYDIDDEEGDKYD